MKKRARACVVSCVKPASDVGYATVQEGVKLAKTCFKSMSLPFFEFLETKSVTETHDIADASLFVLMALEESRWYCAGFRFAFGLTLPVFGAL